ncbi:hypothetical protein RM780_09050 [Streptomyces sp. DSM 44917]|uniref:Gram-positive cocci surface proteins LPxTG domain-containing protein n=1 Tax=Streptomyces boetiae TaxID=3075541 RepID=A0ABU2L732_9ACTN|nr:hypothetical protein [Streptomyces sp. DSM 44917]MDT0307108.1 hypothetical protein [Streptomyces sp. DSM 44917]
MRVWVGVVLAAAALMAVLVPSVAAAVANDEPRPAERSEPAPRRPAHAAQPTGQILPVLPLGAGLTCLGLGLGTLGYRLRRA